jgi:hypothetical protein
MLNCQRFYGVCYFDCAGLQRTAWSDIHSVFEEDFQILILFDLLMNLPPISVACETSFSQMKLIKTSRRLRLSGFTLNSLMLVKLESPSIDEFCPDTAVMKWLTIRIVKNYSTSI